MRVKRRSGRMVLMLACVFLCGCPSSGWAQDPTADQISGLIQQLHDGDPRTRAIAAEKLLRAPGKQVIPALIDALKALIQNQQEFNNAVQEFKKQQGSADPQYGKAESDFQDLASRDTEWKQQAQAYLNQISDLRKSSATPPPSGNAAPSATAQTTPALKPQITLVVPSEDVWTDPIRRDTVVPAQFVLGGVHFAANPTLPDGVNARAKRGDRVELLCTVADDGQVKSCAPQQNTDFANLVAGSASAWRFKDPILLNQGKKKGADKKVGASVPITVDY
ncbi:MAG TPA: hypothetical protein VMT20_12730 [Terriglobia bacterium]|nr:hypothetical protein [Terriglobia bacterium]